MHPIEYNKCAEAYAEKVLGAVSTVAQLAGVACETLHVEHEHVIRQSSMPPRRDGAI